MSVLDKLASALGRNDERPNVDLAEALAAKSDKKAIADLVAALTAGKTPVQNDAIKVLYEIGERRPELIADHAESVFSLLASRNNRNVWGALQAIDTIAAISAKAVEAHLPAILAAADNGSVIAKDKAMSILARLAAAGFADKTVPMLIERLAQSAPNQLPMYAELALPVVTEPHKAAFRAVLEKRLDTMDQASKHTRIEKVLRKLTR